jgi:hypothetical protein
VVVTAPFPVGVEIDPAPAATELEVRVATLDGELRDEPRRGPR